MYRRAGAALLVAVLSVTGLAPLAASGAEACACRQACCCGPRGAVAEGGPCHGTVPDAHASGMRCAHTRAELRLPSAVALLPPSVEVAETRGHSQNLPPSVFGPAARFDRPDPPPPKILPTAS